MPGSGKSTIGKKLAQTLEYTYLDLDAEVERVEGATVKAVFEIKGENYFRQIEAQVLSAVVDQKKNLVVASGGGTPCHYNGLRLMNAKGTTIFIDVSPEILFDRLKFDDNRPLLKDGAEKNILKLHKERIPVYSKAHIKIEAGHISIDDLIKRIVEELKLKP